jgi:hypothetical protein
LPWALFFALALVAGVLVLYFTRGTTLWLDDWQWALYRRGGVHSLLTSYNGHLSLVPVLIYRALFATAGISSYLPFRVLIVAGHLLCGLLVFEYSRRRVGAWLALLAAALILFLGAGWQDFLWPFQIAWLVSLSSGIGALLLLERRQWIADLGACLLLLISLGSSAVGVALLAGAIVDVAWTRRRWRDAWIVLVPVVLYATWSIGYQSATVSASNIFAAPRWAAISVAAAFSALTGLSGQTASTTDAGTVLAFGVPLAVAGLALIVWGVRRGRRWPARAVTWAAIAVVFWILTAIRATSFLGQPYASRYEYVNCVFLLLFAVELAGGLPAGRRLAAGLVVAATAAVVSNVGIMRDAGAYLRSQAPAARADLTALEIARPIAPPSYVASAFPGSPFLVIRAGGYFSMRAAIGSPAYSVSQLIVAPELGRYVADAELAQLDRLALEPVRSRARSTAPLPHLDSSTGGLVMARPPCLSYHPLVASASGGDQLTVTMPSGGLWISAVGGSVVAVRRFGQELHQLGTITGEGPVHLSLERDTAPQPWHVQIQTASHMLVCGE